MSTKRRLGFWVRVVSVGLLFALATGARVAYPALAGEIASAPPGTSLGKQSADSPADAQRLAVLSGRSVEDLSRRSDSSQIFANPDGTWTAESASGPVRVQDGAGVWHDIDTTLVERDGGWVPAFSATDVVLSGGGDSIFAAVGEGDKELDWRWQGTLPQPAVDGNVATYRDVVPGGDLVVTVTPTGFTHNIVLREPPSAPISFTFPVATHGAELAAAPGGGIEIAKANATVLAAAPAPMMWDATQNEFGDHTNVEPVHTAIGETANGTPKLVLTPNDAFLSDPNTAYPVTVDPSFTTYATGDAWLENPNYTTGQVSSEELRVGTYDGGTHVARAYMHFNDGDALWNGKQIISAELNLRNYYSGSCTNGEIQARRITSSWNGNTMTWSNKPSGGSLKMSTFKRAYGYDSTCSADDAVWDITDMARDWADGSYANNGIMLRAADESSSYTWRRYRSADYAAHPALQPKISVTYNSYPDVPTAGSVSNSQMSGGTMYVNSLRPTLSAIVSDPDPGSSSAQFKIMNDSTTVLEFGSGTGSSVGDTSKSTLRLPSGVLSDGSTYKLVIRGTDGSLQSASTDPIWFSVDTSIPEAVVISSNDYPADESWNGDAGVSGDFAVDPQSGDTDHVITWLDGGAAISTPASGGPFTIAVTPTGTGRQKLYAKSVDAAGNESSVSEYSFLVGDLEATSSVALVEQILNEEFAAFVLPPPDDEGDLAETPPEISMSAADDAPSGYVDQEDPYVTDSEVDGMPTDILSLPTDSSGTISQEDPQGFPRLAFDLPDGEGASSAELAGADLVIYPNTSDGVDTIVRRDSGSEIETYHLLRTSAAEQSFQYAASVQPGQTLQISPDGEVISVIDSDGTLLTTIGAPEAVDASGDAVPVVLSLQGDVVLASLAPPEGATPTFPVLVDPSFYSGYGSLTSAEKSFCDNPIHWRDCYRARKDASRALTLAVEFNSSSVHYGAADAFRHCYWNARMTIHIGHDDAYQIATRHESESRGNDKVMDLHNNQVGRWVAAQLASSEHPLRDSRGWCQYYAMGQDLYMLGSWLCSGPDAMTEPPDDFTAIYWSHLPQVCIGPA